MFLTRVSFTILFFLSFFSSVAQKVDNIPFHLTEYNNLSVKTIINETDTVNLMFHTAANSMTLTEEAVKKLKSLRFTENTDSIKSWGGQANSSRLSKGNLIRIGSLTWNDVSIWENINSGQHTDGKFGIDLFKGRVIEIDFDNSMIRLSKKLPEKIKGYQKVKLVRKDGNLFIEAACKTRDSTFKNIFLIHSGYAGALLFDDQFVKDTKLNAQLQVTGEKTLKDSFGKTLKTKQAVLPGLFIDNLKLVDVPAGFFEGAVGRQKFSVLGGDVLKRFNMIIDANREYIYLKTNKWTNTGYTKM
jgi:hypothetical protein